MTDPTLTTTLRVLNEAVAADRVAMTGLVNYRVECNDTLANHPTVQVWAEGDRTYVGLLGILNGILEPITGKRVAAVLSDDDSEVLEFVEYDPVTGETEERK